MSRLFMSREGRRKQERRDQRRAFRQSERAIDEVKDRIKDLDREAKKQWEQARNELKAGQKASAQRLLTSYRAAQVMMTKLEQKRWVFEQYTTKMKMAQSDSEFATAMAALNKVVQIDPERVADVFDTARDMLGEQLDTERFWERLYEKEMEGATGNLEDYIPSMDELSGQLESEAASEVGGKTPEVAGGDEMGERISSNRDRVNKLLDSR
jgi:hypothetical protein